MKNLIILLTLACLFTSCNHSLSGRYEVTAIGGMYGNDTIAMYLRKTLLNREFDLAIDSDAVTMRSLSTQNQFTLKRWKNAKLLTYLTRFTIGDQRYLTILKRDTGFSMDVTLNVPSSYIVPVQNSTVGINNMFAGATSKYARVVCYLNKISN